MTETRVTKRRRLALEILGLIGISVLLTAVLFVILITVAAAVAENYCFYNDIFIDEFDWLAVDRWIFGVSGSICAVFFSVLFLALLSDRMAYIRKLTRGIDALRLGQAGCTVPLEGRNELTELADAINYLAVTQQRLREKEQALQQEKEQFLRTLSHDIRTPLTAILGYSEFLTEENTLSPEERKEYLQTVCRKAEQIRDLTGLLLDGGNRSPEHFEDVRLLLWQLAEEFEAELEQRFAVTVDLSGCTAFAGTFDVQELRRIFDNLCSNVHKYAAPEKPVALRIRADAGEVVICQSNTPRADAAESTGHRLGIHSIRRLAQNYGGSVTVAHTAQKFEICIVLSEFS